MFALYHTLIIVVSGVCLLGWVAGMLGCFAFLKKQSLLADAIAHAALPGVAGIFLLTQSNNPLILLTGGAISGLLGTFLINAIARVSSLKYDTAIGIVLSVFFGLGLVLLTVIQKYPIAQQAVLNKFLYGSAATLLVSDVQLIFITTIIILFLVWFFWKPFVLITFDPVYAQLIGIPVFAFDLLLITILALVIVIGLQTVGVVLMSTMVIGPAVIARQWTCTMWKMVFCAGGIGLASALAGTLMSSTSEHMPTGPVIVVVISGLIFISLLLSPRSMRKYARLRVQ